MPEMFIIAGCNGAGKTTAAYNLLPEVFNAVEFINADEIARGLSPLNPSGAAIPAARIMLERIEQMLGRNESFAIETTLSGLTYLDVIKKARAKKFKIIFFFVYLSGVTLATERVAIRVNKGGHSIPADIIERRYKRGLQNLPHYLAEADGWYIYNNSASEYELVAKSIDKVREITNFELFRTITKNNE